MQELSLLGRLCIRPPCSLLILTPPATDRYMLKSFHFYTMKTCCSPTPSKDLLYLRYALVGSDRYDGTIHKRTLAMVLIPVLSRQRTGSTRCARRTLQAPTKPYLQVCLSRNPTRALQDWTNALRSSGRGGQ